MLWEVAVRLYLRYVGCKVDVINSSLREVDEVLLALCTQQDDRVQSLLHAVQLLRDVLSVLEKEKGEKPQRCVEIRGLSGLSDRKQMLVLLEQCCFVFSGLLHGGRHAEHS